MVRKKIKPRASVIFLKNMFEVRLGEMMKPKRHYLDTYYRYILKLCKCLEPPKKIKINQVTFFIDQTVMK